MFKRTCLALGLSLACASTRSAQAGTLPIDAEPGLISEADRQVLMDELALIPQYRLKDISGVRIIKESFVGYQWDGHYINVFLPPSGERSSSDLAIPWGWALINGVAGKDLYRMFYDHPDWRDQYLDWIKVAQPEADFNGFYLSSNFKGDHESWYRDFPPKQVGEMFDAQLQRYLFQAALQSSQGQSMYATSSADGSALEVHSVAFQLQGHTLHVGDFTIEMSGDFTITRILKNGVVVKDGLSITLNPFTLQLIHANNGAPSVPGRYPRPLPNPGRRPVIPPWADPIIVTKSVAKQSNTNVIGRQAPNANYVPLNTEAGRIRLSDPGASAHDVSVVAPQ